METNQRIKSEITLLEETLLKKNQNYGNSFAAQPILDETICPEDGIIVRVSDKISRLKTLLSGESDLVAESISDTLLDIAGYCLLWRILRAEETEAKK